MKYSSILTKLFLIGLLSYPLHTHAQCADVFAKSNLAAWCVVPFDAKKRGPEERAQMLHELGIQKLAYDWREEHIPTFDQELKALNKYNIKLEAFWMMSDQNPERNAHIEAIFDFLERNQVKTQIWLLLGEWNGFAELSQPAKVEAMARPIQYIAERAAKLGCKVALYNHGGWFGEPENQLEILEKLQLNNVGMVYNFHHARMHHDRFATFFPKILPHLLGLNIAGLKTGVTDRFFRTGQGDVEQEMIRLVWKSGYQGTIGIINHDMEEDAARGLQMELEGLKSILLKIGAYKALKTFP
jgi:sugar phosphate isomerase/epimerase